MDDESQESIVRNQTFEFVHFGISNAPASDPTHIPSQTCISNSFTKSKITPPSMTFLRLQIRTRVVKLFSVGKSAGISAFLFHRSGSQSGQRRGE